MDSYILMNGLCNQSVDCVSKEIRNLEECAWKKELGASLELIKKRLNIFPNGLWSLIVIQDSIPAILDKCKS